MLERQRKTIQEYPARPLPCEARPLPDGQGCRTSRLLSRTIGRCTMIFVGALLLALSICSPCTAMPSPGYALLHTTLTARTTTLAHNEVLIDGASIIGSSGTSVAELFIDLANTDPTTSVNIVVRNSRLTFAAVYLVGFTNAFAAAGRLQNITVLFQNITATNGLVGLTKYFPSGFSLTVEDSFFYPSTTAVAFTYKSSWYYCAVFWKDVVLDGASVALRRNVMSSTTLTSYYFLALESTATWIASSVVLEGIAIRFYGATSSTQTALVQYRSASQSEMRCNRSILALLDSTTSTGALYLMSPVAFYDRTVVWIENIRDTFSVVECTNTLKLDQTSWMYLRRVTAIVRVLPVVLLVTNGHRISLFEVSVVGSRADAILWGGSNYQSIRDGAPYGCVSDLIDPTMIVAPFGMSNTSRYVSCAACTLATQCYEAMALSVAYSEEAQECVCTCAPGSYGPRCLPWAYRSASSPTTLPDEANRLELLVENVVIASTADYDAGVSSKRRVLYRNVTFIGPHVIVHLLEAMGVGASLPASTANITFDRCTFSASAVLTLWGSSYAANARGMRLNVTISNCLFNRSGIAVNGNIPMQSYILIAHCTFISPQAATIGFKSVPPRGTYSALIAVLLRYVTMSDRSTLIVTNASSSMLSTSGGTPRVFISTYETSSFIHRSAVHMTYSRVVGTDALMLSSQVNVDANSTIFVADNFFYCYRFTTTIGILLDRNSAFVVLRNHGSTTEDMIFTASATIVQRQSLLLVANNTVESVRLIFFTNTVRVYDVGSNYILMDNRHAPYSTIASTDLYHYWHTATANRLSRCNLNFQGGALVEVNAPAGLVESCTANRSTRSSYCHPTFTVSVHANGTCVCANQSMTTAEDGCFPTPLYPYYRTDAMRADPADVINTTYLLEDAVVQLASTHNTMGSTLQVGAGYRSLVFRNVRFVGIAVEVTPNAFAQIGGPQLLRTSVTFERCSFESSKFKLYFTIRGLIAAPTTYIPMAVHVESTQFINSAVEIAYNPPFKTNLTFVNASTHLYQWIDRPFQLHHMTLVSGRVVMEHYDIRSVVFIASYVFSIILDTMVFKDRSLFMVHGATANHQSSGASNVPSYLFYFLGGVTFKNHTVGYIRGCTLSGGYEFLEVGGDVHYVQDNSSFVLENNVAGTTSGLSSIRYLHMLYLTGGSFFLVKRNSFMFSGGAMLDFAWSGSSGIAINTNSVFAVVESEMDATARDILRTYNFYPSAPYRIVSKCNYRQSLLVTTGSQPRFTEALPCSGCASDIECFAPLTLSTANCTCLCRAGGFGPRCLPVDTTLLWSDVVVRPDVLVIENTVLRTTTFARGIRSLTLRNVTIGNWNDVVVYPNLMMDNEGWRGDTFVLVVENCTIADSASFIIVGSFLNTLSNNAVDRIIGGMNVSIVGTKTTAYDGDVVLMYPMPQRSRIAISDSELSHSTTPRQGHYYLTSATEQWILFVQFLLVEDSHLSITRIRFRVPGKLLYSESGIAVMARSSFVIEGVQASAQANVAILGSLLVRDQSAFIVRNSSLGNSATSALMQFTSSLSFDNRSVFLIEGNNFVGCYYIVHTSYTIAFTSSSLFGFFNNVLDAVNEVFNGARTVAINSNSSAAVVGNSVGAPQFYTIFTLSAAFSFEIGCNFVRGQGEITAAKANVIGLASFTRLLTGCWECTVSSTCFTPLTAAFDASSCTCTCLVGGYGPRCLPGDAFRALTQFPTPDVAIERLNAFRTFVMRDTTWSGSSFSIDNSYRYIEFTRVTFTISHVDLRYNFMANEPLTLIVDNCSFTNTRFYMRHSNLMSVYRLMPLNATFRNVVAKDVALLFLYQLSTGSTFSILNSTLVNTITMGYNYGIATSPRILNFYFANMWNCTVAIVNSLLNNSAASSVAAGFDNTALKSSALIVKDSILRSSGFSLYCWSIDVQAGSVLAIVRSELYGGIEGLVYVLSNAALLIADTYINAGAGRPINIGDNHYPAGSAVFLSNIIVESSVAVASDAVTIWSNAQYIYDSVSVSAGTVQEFSQTVQSNALYLVQCVTAARSLPLNTTASLVGANINSGYRLLPCRTCERNVSCFLPLTNGYDQVTCSCICSALGQGPRCLPWNVDALPEAGQQAGDQHYSSVNESFTEAPSFSVRYRSISFLNATFAGTMATARIFLSRLQPGYVTILFLNCQFSSGAVVYLFGEANVQTTDTYAIVTFRNCTFLDAGLVLAKSLVHTQVLLDGCRFSISVQVNFWLIRFPATIAATNGPAVVVTDAAFHNTSLEFVNCTFDSWKAAIVVANQFELQARSSLVCIATRMVVGTVALLFGGSLVLNGGSLLLMEASTVLAQTYVVQIPTTLVVANASTVAWFDVQMASASTAVLYVGTSTVVSDSSWVLLDRVVASGPIGTATPCLFLGTAPAVFQMASTLSLMHVHMSQDVYLRPTTVRFDSGSAFHIRCSTAGGVEMHTAGDVIAAGGTNVSVVTACGATDDLSDIACFPSLSAALHASWPSTCQCTAGGFGDRCLPAAAPSNLQLLPALPSRASFQSYELQHTTVVGPLVLGPRTHGIRFTNVTFRGATTRIVVYLPAMRPPLPLVDPGTTILTRSNNDGNTLLNVTLLNCTMLEGAQLLVVGGAAPLHPAFALSLVVDGMEANYAAIALTNTLPLWSSVIISRSAFRVNGAFAAWPATVDVFGGYVGPTTKCAVHFHKLNLTSTVVQFALVRWNVEVADTTDSVVLGTGAIVSLVNTTLLFRWIVSSQDKNHFFYIPSIELSLVQQSSIMFDASVVLGKSRLYAIKLNHASSFRFRRSWAILNELEPLLYLVTNSVLSGGSVFAIEGSTLHGAQTAFVEFASTQTLQKTGVGLIQIRDSQFNKRIFSMTTNALTAAAYVACTSLLNQQADAFTLAAFKTAAGLGADTTVAPCGTCSINATCDPTYTTSISETNTSCTCNCASDLLQYQPYCAPAPMPPTPPTVALSSDGGCLQAQTLTGRLFYGLGTCLENVTFTGASTYVTIITNASFSPGPAAAFIRLERVRLLEGAVMVVLGSNPLNTKPAQSSQTFLTIRSLVAVNGALAFRFDFRRVTVLVENATMRVTAAISYPTSLIPQPLDAITTALYFHQVSFRDHSSFTLLRSYIETAVQSTNHAIYFAGSQLDVAASSAFVLQDSVVNATLRALWLRLPVSIADESVWLVQNCRFRSYGSNGIGATTIVVQNGSTFLFRATKVVAPQSSIVVSSLTVTTFSWVRFQKLLLTIYEAPTNHAISFTTADVDYTSTFSLMDSQSIGGAALFAPTTALGTSYVLRCNHARSVPVSEVPGMYPAPSILDCATATDDPMFHCHPTNTLSVVDGLCVCNPYPVTGAVAYAPYCLPVPLPDAVNTTTITAQTTRTTADNRTDVIITAQERIGLGLSEVRFTRVNFTGRNAQFVVNVMDMEPGEVLIELVNCSIADLATLYILGEPESYNFGQRLTVRITGLRVDSGGVDFSLSWPVGSAVYIRDSTFAHTNIARTHYALPSGAYNTKGTNLAMYKLAMNGSTFNISNSRFNTLRSDAAILFDVSFAIFNRSTILFYNSILGSPVDAIRWANFYLYDFSAFVLRDCVLTAGIKVENALDLYNSSSFVMVDASFQMLTTAGLLNVVYRVIVDGQSNFKVIRVSHAAVNPTTFIALGRMFVYDGTIVATENLASTATFWTIPITSFGANALYVTGCNYNGPTPLPDKLSGWIASPNQTQPCLTCIKAVSCFPPLTTSFDSTLCTCQCAEGGRLPDCLSYPTEAVPTGNNSAVYQDTEIGYDNSDLVAFLNSIVFERVVVNGPYSQQLMMLSSMPRGRVFITMRNVLVTNGSVVYVAASDNANPFQVLTLDIDNCTFDQGALVIFGAFPKGSVLSITNSTFAIDAMRGGAGAGSGPAVAFPWIADGTIWSAAGTPMPESRNAPLTFFRFELDGQASFAMRNSHVVSRGTLVGSTAHPGVAEQPTVAILFLGPTVLAGGSNFLLASCIVESWSSSATVPSAAFYAESSIKLTYGSAFVLTRLSANAPLFLNLVELHNGSLVQIDMSVLVNALLDGAGQAYAPLNVTSLVLPSAGGDVIISNTVADGPVALLRATQVSGSTTSSLSMVNASVFTPWMVDANFASGTRIQASCIRLQNDAPVISAAEHFSAFRTAVANIGTCGVCNAVSQCASTLTSGFDSTACTCSCTIGKGYGPMCAPTAAAAAALEAGRSGAEAHSTPPEPVVFENRTIEAGVTTLGLDQTEIVVRNLVLSGPMTELRVYLSLMRHGTDTALLVNITNVTLQDGATLYIIGSAGGSSYVHKTPMISIHNLVLIDGAIVVTRHLPLFTTLIVSDIVAVSHNGSYPVPSGGASAANDRERGGALYFIQLGMANSTVALRGVTAVSTNAAAIVVIIGNLTLTRTSRFVLEALQMQCAVAACVHAVTASATATIAGGSILAVRDAIFDTPSSAGAFAIAGSLRLQNASALLLSDNVVEAPSLLRVQGASRIQSESQLVLLRNSIQATTARVVNVRQPSLLFAEVGLVIEATAALVVRNNGARYDAPAVALANASGTNAGTGQVVLTCNRFGTVLATANDYAPFLRNTGTTNVTIAACERGACAVHTHCFPPRTSASVPSASGACACTCQDNIGDPMCLLLDESVALSTATSTHSPIDEPLALKDVVIDGDNTVRVWSGSVPAGQTELSIENVTLVGPARLVLDLTSLLKSTAPNPVTINIMNVSLSNGSSLSVVCSPMPWPVGSGVVLRIDGLDAVDSVVYLRGTFPPNSDATLSNMNFLFTGDAVGLGVVVDAAPYLLQNLSIGAAGLLLDAIGVVHSSSLTIAFVEVVHPVGNNAAIALGNDLWVAHGGQLQVVDQTHSARYALYGGTLTRVRVEDAALLLVDRLHHTSTGGGLLHARAIDVLVAGSVLVLNATTGNPAYAMVLPTVAATNKGNLSIGTGRIDDPSAVLINGVYALHGLINAWTIAVANHSEIALIGNAVGDTTLLVLTAGWTLPASNGSRYYAISMGCNVLNGIPFVLPEMYLSAPSSPMNALTQPVCNNACGSNARCLSATLAQDPYAPTPWIFAVVPCACSCLDLRPVCSTTLTRSKSVSVSTSASISPSSSSSASLSPSRSISATLSLSVSANASYSGTASLSLSETSSCSITPSITNASTVSLTQSLSASRSVSKSLTSTISTTHTATGSVTASASSTQSVSATNTDTTSRSQSQTKSPSTSQSPTASFSRSPSRASLTVHLTQSASVTDSMSVTLGASASMTVSLSIPSGTRGASQSVSLTQSPSPSNVQSRTDSGSTTRTTSLTPSETHSHSTSSTASLSPVWPDAVGVTATTALVVYLQHGVQWFNVSGGPGTVTTFTAWPRRLDGAAMPASFYRHPQPPFTITLPARGVGGPQLGDAVVVDVSTQCGLALPCTFRATPSYDANSVASLNVQYENQMDARTVPVVVAYEPRDPTNLQTITARTGILAICEATPFPEVRVRAVDVDGFAYNAGRCIDTALTVCRSGTTIGGTAVHASFLLSSYPVTGQLGPPLHLFVQPLHQAASGRAVGNVTLTFTPVDSGLAETVAPTTVTVDIVACPPRVVSTRPTILLHGHASVVRFYVPFTTLHEHRDVLCVQTNGATRLANDAAVRVAPDIVDCALHDNATALDLVLHHHSDNDVGTTMSTLRDIPARVLPPSLQFRGAQVANRSTTLVSGRLGCVVLAWRAVRGSTQVPYPASLVALQSATGHLVVERRDKWQSPLVVTSSDHGVTVESNGSSDGSWMLCPAPLPHPFNAPSYRAEVTITAHASAQLLNGTIVKASASTAIVYVPDNHCLDRNMFVLAESTDANALTATTRDVVSTAPIPLDPVHGIAIERVFVDNATCTIAAVTDAHAFRISLASCVPPLRAATSGSGADQVFDRQLHVLQPSHGGLLGIVTSFQHIPLPTPRIFALVGCPKDSFPSAIGCPVRGTTPLTIVGEHFRPQHNVSFVFADNPSEVPCKQLVLVSPTTLVCHQYPGFGTNGSVVLFNATDRSQLLAERRGLLTFGPNAAGQCPTGSNGLVCSGRGSCDPVTGLCVCERSPQTGYWGGTDCGICDTRFNNSNGCMLPCPLSEHNVICSGRGPCANGLCWCGTSWSSSACDADCPGVGAACSGHGTCNALDGTCACAQHDDGGGFAPPTCAACVAGYSGSACDLPCPIGPNLLICSGNGTCFDGFCICGAAFCGETCHLVVGVDDCGSCPAAGLYGANCDRMCPGASVTEPCSGHGVCSAGRFGSGQCLCEDGYGQSDCSAACPFANGGELCGGLGTCSPLTGQCLCQRFYGGAACTVACPRSADDGLICSGHGQCDEGAQGTGACLCAIGYSGATCNITCSASSVPCSGRGVCTSDGTCICNSDPLLGYWSGASCDTCAALYAGPDCNGQCPTSIANVA